jgi:hypothetical protein
LNKKKGMFLSLNTLCWRTYEVYISTLWTWLGKWIYIEVKEGKKVNFICSYTSYGISELLERLYQLVADVPVSEINPNPMFGDEEPNGTLWTLKKVGDSELLLHIEYEQEYPEKREALLKEKVYKFSLKFRHV